VSDTQLYDLELVLVTVLFGALIVGAVVGLLEYSQRDLHIRRIMLIAFGIRIVAAFAVGNLSAAQALRGGDETFFVLSARSLARWDLVSTQSLDVMIHKFHVFAFSVDFQLFGRAPDMMLRAQVITLAVLGVAFLATAVYELAGPRPAYVAAWILALEPANVFFSGILHKEPFMLFAEGLVAFGGAVLWKRGRFEALIPMILGCLIATATRPYVGWFLAASAAAVTLHASLRFKHQVRSVLLGIVVFALLIAFVPTVWNASSTRNLQSLQQSQDANASDTTSNLSLERVDYSRRDKIIVNLPKRMLDIITRPYPWQVGNLSQQLGVLGTLSMALLLVLLVSTIARNGGALFSRAGPLIYPLLFLLVAYSLSAGNAGTAFRYRTHLVAFLVALVCVLRWSPGRARAGEPVRSPGQPEPVALQGVR
jgi:hypothetical protein